MVTNQSLVLKSLYWSGKEQTVNQISKDTGLTKIQVHTVLVSLRKMGYVKIRRISPHWNNGERIPPKIFIQLKSIPLAEKTLRKRGVL